MNEKPILFSGPMVRAILEGRKTMTRRVVKPQPELSFIVETDTPGLFGDEEGETKPFRCPYGKPGDRLWVRETWKPTGIFAGYTPSKTHACSRFAYQADHDQQPRDAAIRWRSSIHMPRWASRITLEVTSVRVERLQDISEEDAKAEGVFPGERSPSLLPHQRAFRNLWGSIHGPGSWVSNPWVWVYEFERKAES